MDRNRELVPDKKRKNFKHIKKKRLKSTLLSQNTTCKFSG